MLLSILYSFNRTLKCFFLCFFLSPARTAFCAFPAFLTALPLGWGGIVFAGLDQLELLAIKSMKYQWMISESSQRLIYPQTGVQITNQ